MKRFNFYIVSKDESFMMSKEDFSSDDTNVELVSNNKESICKIYNKILEKHRVNKVEDEYVIFMHSDVKLDVNHLKEHIIECSDKYDVMGLCGCEKVKISQSPLNWFTASNPFPEYRWGCVTHGELGNHKSFFSSNKTEKDHSVGAIDGLCIIFNVNSINSKLKFDEKFQFDQYDFDISLQTILNYKMRLGVIVEESLQHYSVGRSILGEEFLVHEFDLRKKWNFDIPVNSKLDNMIKSGRILT